MKTITYVLTDELGLHARPAGILVKTAAKFPGKVEISGSGKTVDGKRILGVMGLGLKQGDTLTITFDGDGEDEAAANMEQFLKDNL